MPFMETLLMFLSVVVAALPWVLARLIGKRRLIREFGRNEDSLAPGILTIVAIMCLSFPVLMVLVLFFEGYGYSFFFGHAFGHPVVIGILVGLCSLVGGFCYGMACWCWLSEP